MYMKDCINFLVCATFVLESCIHTCDADIFKALHYIVYLLKMLKGTFFAPYFYSYTCMDLKICRNIEMFLLNAFLCFT
jgi:hypothetical protein